MQIREQSGIGGKDHDQMNATVQIARFAYG
jgi:hypothetical protein